jgi:hypothetical protein
MVNGESDWSASMAPQMDASNNRGDMVRPITTERLLLRPVTTDDVDRLGITRQRPQGDALPDGRTPVRRSPSSFVALGITCGPRGNERPGISWVGSRFGHPIRVSTSWDTGSRSTHGVEVSRPKGVVP